MHAMKMILGVMFALGAPHVTWAATIQAHALISGQMNHALTVRSGEGFTEYQQLLGAQQVMTLLAYYTATATQQIIDGALIRNMGDGSTMTEDVTHAFAVLEVFDGKLWYASVSNPTTRYFYDGSLASYRFMQRVVLGADYQDPYNAKYYDLPSQRPRKKIKDCRDDLACFENAAKTCQLAAVDMRLPFNGKVLSNRYEIWGADKQKRCIVYGKFMGWEPALSSVEQDLAKRGLDGICTQPPKALTKSIQDTRRGIYTTANSVTLDCHGLFYQRP